MGQGSASRDRCEPPKMSDVGEGFAQVKKSSSTHELVSSSDNKYFTTKLSLPKLMSVAKKLTKPQIKLVEELGFHHLLDLSCSQIKKSVVLYLVKHFDVSTRSLVLPNGYTITLTPLQVHQILGISIGGFSLPRSSEDNINKLTSAYIKCSRKYPSINELMALITDDLDGDKFKMVFTLFVISCFLCPSSNDSSSPEFCSLVLKSDRIGSYDWAGIVLDKLVEGIDKFQHSKSTCGVSTLSGCVFLLMVIYFEFLDISDYHLPSSVPRIKVWTTEIVRKFTELDCINEELAIFGRKPMKAISLTALSKVNLTEGSFIDIELDVRKILNSLLPGEEFANVRLQLEGTYAQMWSDLLKVARPSIIEQILKTAEIIKSNYRSFPDKAVRESSNLCHSSDKVVPEESSSLNQRSKKNVELLEFEPLRLAEITPVSEKLASYDDIFHMTVNSLSAMNLEEINDFADVAEPLLQEFLLSVPCNEYHELESSPSLQSISELTLSILNLEPSLSRPNVMEPKEEFSFLAEPVSLIPFKKRPISNDLQINGTEGVCLEQPLFVTTAKKLRFDSDESRLETGVSTSEQDSIFRRDDIVQSGASHFDFHDDIFDEETVRMLDESVSQLQNMRSMQSSTMQMPSVPAKAAVPAKASFFKENESVTENRNIRFMQSATMEFPSVQGSSIPSKPTSFKHSFTSSAVEKAVHQYIISNIPGPQPARSPKIIKISKVNWVDHRTFGLSMQVYGSISPHVMNIMGVAVMEEQFRKDFTDCLPCTEWCKHILSHSISVQLQDPELVPTDISNQFLEICIGFRLDNADLVSFADLVFVPACKNRYWYAVIANFRERKFEVACPFKDLNIIREDALVIISNFRKVFKCAYPVPRRFDVFKMGHAFASVSNSSSQNDSGAFVLEILKSYDGRTHLFFKEEHAQAIRESLTYYLCTLEDNLILLPAVRDIALRHGIKL